MTAKEESVWGGRMSTEVAKRNGRQLVLSGFQARSNGLIANKGLTREQWDDAGNSLFAIEGCLSWYLGDWLSAAKGEEWGYGYGDLEAICEEKDWNYGAARVCKSVCEAYDLLDRSNKLTFSHHKVAQGPDQKDLLEWAETNNATVAELRHEKRRRRDAALIAAPVKHGKFRVIYADPPWEYNSGDQHSRETQETVLGTHYPSMSLEAICKLEVAEGRHVSDLAHEHCVLFLWCTSPTLEEAFQVLTAWGFDYKASMVWDKVSHNVGHYVSVRHELLLIATKGQPPKVPKLVDSVYVEERTEHSRKPEYFRTLITDLYAGPRIELWCRGDVPKGWKSWGNEAK